ncbi:Transcription factor-like protein DPB [Linum grandiflorum]
MATAGGGAHQDDVDKSLSAASARTRSWGTATASGGAAGQSVSTSGSVGSPSNAATPASDSTFLRLNNLDIHADDAATQDAANKKKKRGQRVAGADKSGRGLRQFSMKVCEKVQSKGTTTYNEVSGSRFCFSFSMQMIAAFFCFSLSNAFRVSDELLIRSQVADELVAEFADPGGVAAAAAGPDQVVVSINPVHSHAIFPHLVIDFLLFSFWPQFDEKNIRRRVYDALNVLMALDIISKDKKEIHWKGLPRTSQSDVEEMKGEKVSFKNRNEKKAQYLQEMEDQYVGLQNLIERNKQLYSSGNAPSGGVSLPFILVQTRPHATVEVEISEDMQLVHFDFNSTPFELHDDNYVMKAMKMSERPPPHNNGSAPNMVVSGSSMNHQQQQQQHQHQQFIPTPLVRANAAPTSPPIPGIIKARSKHEH